MKIRKHQLLTCITIGMSCITVVAGILLTGNPAIFPGMSIAGSNNAFAQTTSVTNTSVKVSNFCSMTATIEPGEEHTVTLIGGQYQSDIGLTTIQTFCNDPNGYAIYAMGYTGGDFEIYDGTSTSLRSYTTAASPTYYIPTGTATSGDTSNWAMKVNSIPGTYAPTIQSDADGSFASYHKVPEQYAKVASFGSATDLATIGSSIAVTYAVYVSPLQPVGVYNGNVKYTLVHPAISLMPGVNYMQDVDEWGPSIGVGQETIAYDNRDNKSYYVYRACMDGTGSDWHEKEANCTRSMLWMTQNLDLDLDSSIPLNSMNTNLTSEAANPSYSIGSDGIIYWTPDYSTVNTIADDGKFNTWENILPPFSADPDGGVANYPWYTTGDLYNSSLCSTDIYTCNYLNKNNATATNYFSHNAYIDNGAHGKIGNYYNWMAATAYSYTGDAAIESPNSICPKGWRLPAISSSRNDFKDLNKIYNGDSTSDGSGLISGPIFMIRSGYLTDKFINYAGSEGRYWFNTQKKNSDYAYALSLSSNNVNTTSTAGKWRGNSVRCVSDIAEN